MRERFEQQMEILHTELIELGALCEQAIGRTYEVLLEGNQRAAEEIIKKDQTHYFYDIRNIRCLVSDPLHIGNHF